MKFVNAYIIYDLISWPRSPLNIFTLKHSLFGATNIEKDTNKHKWKYKGYGITFDGKGMQNFGNDFARNNIIFVVDINLSSHRSNRKNDFLFLCERPIEGINDSIGAAEQKLSIHLSKRNTKFYLHLHYNGGKNYLFVKQCFRKHI